MSSLPIQTPRRRRRENSSSSWLFKHITENPLAWATAVVSVSGGLLLLAFFCQLGQFPELDLAGAGAILMAVTLLGSLFSFGLTGCAFGAGLALTGDNSVTSDVRSVKGVLMLSLPGWLATVALAIWFSFDWGKPSVFIYWMTIVVAAGLCWWYARHRPDAGAAMPSTPVPRGVQLERAATFAGYSAVWLMTALASVLTLYAIFSRSADAGSFSVAMVIWCTWCYLSNSFVGLARHITLWKRVLLACSISLMVLLVIAENGMGFVRATVRALGLGDTPVALVLSRDGCEMLNSAAGTTVCASGDKASVAVACPVHLRSRIGSHFFVQLSPYDGDGVWPAADTPRRLAAIAIPRDEVLSWSSLTPMKASDAAKEKAPAGIASHLNAKDQGAWLRGQCGPTTVRTVP